MADHISFFDIAAKAQRELRDVISMATG